MNKYTIGIIGGTGSMGRWFERFFSQSGHKVLISSRKTKLTPNELVKKCDIVILSTPIDITVRMAQEIGPLLSKDQLFTDFCSLKEDVVKTMLNSSNCHVIGMHPMFGPFTDSIKGQNIILCPGRGTDWIDWLEGEFKQRGGVVTRMDPATHDKNMAVFQGLTHLLSITMGRTLQKMNMPPAKVKEYSTPVFKVNIDLIGRLFAQDLGLYSNLVGGNKYVKETIETFLAALKEGEECLLSGNKEKGIGFLENIRDFLGDFCQTGMEESNEILNTLLKKSLK